MFYTGVQQSPPDSPLRGTRQSPEKRDAERVTGRRSSAPSSSSEGSVRRNSGLGRGASPFFTPLQDFSFPKLLQDEPPTCNSSGQADRLQPQATDLKTASQSPPPKPPRRRSPKVQPKVPKMSQETGEDTTLNPPPPPPSQTHPPEHFRPSVDTIYLPPAPKPATSSNYDMLLPKTSTDTYDHLGPGESQLASLLPNTMNRRSAVGPLSNPPQTDHSTTTKEAASTLVNSDSNQGTDVQEPVGNDVSEQKNQKGEEGGKEKEEEKNVKEDGGVQAEPKPPPWRSLPRVLIKEEPKVIAFPWRKMLQKAESPQPQAMQETARDIEYSMEPRNFSQQHRIHTPQRQIHLGKEEKIEEEERKEEKDEEREDEEEESEEEEEAERDEEEEEEQERAVKEESNAAVEENTKEERDEVEEEEPSYPWRRGGLAASLSTSPGLMMDLEYSMEPRMYSARPQHVPQVLQSSEAHKEEEKTKQRERMGKLEEENEEAQQHAEIDGKREAKKGDKEEERNSEEVTRVKMEEVQKKEEEEDEQDHLVNGDRTAEGAIKEEHHIVEPVGAVAQGGTERRQEREKSADRSSYTTSTSAEKEGSFSEQDVRGKPTSHCWPHTLL